MFITQRNHIRRLIFVTILLNASMVKAQEAKSAPGLDIIGRGYDVFGQYASQESLKDYRLFDFGESVRIERVGDSDYALPELVFLTNISEHEIKTIEGSSLRDYTRSLATKAGLEGESMFFSGSINSSFETTESGAEQHFYYTYIDANIKWRISLKERQDRLLGILDPEFNDDLYSLDAQYLFQDYGTHFIASAYIGGRAEFTSKSIMTEETSKQDIKIAVRAKYNSIKTNSNLDMSSLETLKKAKTETRLLVVGGNSQFANNIKDNEQYELWAKGIEKRPVLCDFESETFLRKGSLRPIWDLCEDEDRREELKREYDELCKRNPLPALVTDALTTTSYYAIMNRDADKTLTHYDDELHMGDNWVVDKQVSTNISGDWHFEQYKPGLYWIVHRETGRLLTNYEGVYAGGSQVKQDPGGSGKWSLWRIEKAGLGKSAYYIRNFVTNKYLSWYSGHSMYAGNKPQAWIIRQLEEIR